MLTGPTMNTSSLSLNPASASVAPESDSLPSPEYGTALANLYSHFFTSGVAYTQDGVSAPRYYCLACLANEVESVRAARQKFGQGQNAPLEVLQQIAITRLDFYYPSPPLLPPTPFPAASSSSSPATLPRPPRDGRQRVDKMLEHLLRVCPYISAANKKSIRNQCAIIMADDLQAGGGRMSKRQSECLGLDFGSVHEETRYSEHPGNNLALLIPGSASPGRIFSSRERILLQKAQVKRETKYRTKARKEEAKKRRKLEGKQSEEHPGSGEVDQEGRADGSDEGDSGDEDGEREGQEEDREEAQRPASEENVRQTHPRIEKRFGVDASALYDPSEEEADNDVDLPRGFPDSDLLKALQTHAGDLYASRGLLSTEATPLDPHTGERIPSMVQALDGTALIALGILAQELVRASVLPNGNAPRPMQPVSDLYPGPRRPGKSGWDPGEPGKRLTESMKQATDKVLRQLGEGSAIGMKDLSEACRPSHGTSEGLAKDGANEAGPE